jgi:hypothetical protein
VEALYTTYLIITQDNIINTKHPHSPNIITPNIMLTILILTVLKNNYKNFEELDWNKKELEEKCIKMNSE